MFQSRLPAIYRNRPSQKENWELAYGRESAHVEWLLANVCNAFGFPQESRYQFSPEDRISDIYRNCYPRWKVWVIGDSLELESFILEVEKRVNLDACQVTTISIGEMMDRVIGIE